MKLHIIGRGKVGRAFAAAAREANLPFTISAGRALLVPPPAGLTVYVLAVPDAAMSAVAERLASVVRARDVVLHCSGNRGPEELSACAAQGAFTASVHPMLSFASAKHPPDLAQSVWIARGHRRAILAAQKLARAVSARCIEGPSGQPAYHAAAALLANGSAALSHLFVDLLKALGLAQGHAELAAAGMLHSVANNVRRVGVPYALTGPVRRGDADTVKAHLAALDALDPPLAQRYRELSALILHSARTAGLTPAEAARVEHALRHKPRGPRKTLRYKGKPARKRPR